MRLMCLDLATRFGFACGVAGAMPRSGSKCLKDTEDPPERAFRKLGIWLRDEFAFEGPDLVVCEAPVNLGAFIEGDPTSPKGFKFKSRSETIYLLQGLVAVVHGICGPYGIRCVNANVQTVRKHCIGIARPKDPKRAVVERAHLLGLMPKTDRDDNRGDACLLFQFASDAWCKPATRELHLMQEVAR